MEPPGLIDIIHHLFNFISIRIRSVAKEIPIFKRLLGNFLIFTTFPPEDSLGLFVCYEGHIQDVKTVEIVFVAICSRSYHKMPVLYCLSKIRKYLTVKASLNIYKTTIIPYFDYGDFVYEAATKSMTEKLQRIQNIGA